MRSCGRLSFRLCLIVALGLTFAVAAGGASAGHWLELPAGTPLGKITASAEPPSSLRAQTVLVDPSRGPSGRLLVFSYTPRGSRETAALLIPALLAEPLWKLDQHAIARAADESGEHPRLNNLSQTLTRLGNWPAMAAMCGALYAGGDAHSRRAAQDVASAGLTATLTAGLLKRTFRRARPDHAASSSGDTSFSFPSGHAASAFSTATIIAHHYPDLKEAVYVGAALISVSRVSLGRHYPTDIIAGAVVGTLVAKQVLKRKGNLLEWRW